MPVSRDLFAEVAMLRDEVDDMNRSVSALTRQSGLLEQILAAMEKDVALANVFLAVDGQRTQTDIVTYLKDNGLEGASKATVSRKIDALNRLGAIVATTLAATVITANPALASSTEAVTACDASPYDSESAYVPPEYRQSPFLSIRSTKGTFPINCGNGGNYGAVHIELKHEVPNWAEAATCITKAINRANTVGPGSGENTTKYTWRSSGLVIIVIRGANGIITAYPEGGAEGPKWTKCASIP